MTTREKFAVFCAKAFAGIGRLSDTIMDRSIILNLKRKAPDEAAERFRWREANAETEGLRQRLPAWGGENLEALAVARPDSPGELDDRAAEGWEPLLAIADLAGGAWPSVPAARRLTFQQARPAKTIPSASFFSPTCAASSKSTTRKSSPLLSSLRSLSRSRSRPGVICAAGPSMRAASHDGCDDMRSGRKRFGSERTVKGYAREQFEPSWQRYLQSAAPFPRFERHTVTTRIAAPATIALGCVARRPRNGAEEGLNPHGYADVTLVTRTAPADGHTTRRRRRQPDADDPLRPLLGDPGFEGLTRRRFLEGHLTELERDTLVGFHPIRRQRAKVLERSPERHEAATE